MQSVYWSVIGAILWMLMVTTQVSFCSVLPVSQQQTNEEPHHTTELLCSPLQIDILICLKSLQEKCL